jgi:hypothetical protein
VLNGKVDVQNGSYELAGGTLSTPLLDKGAGGSFQFTGGVLHADEVAFDLVNAGGMLAPGQSIGQTQVTGNLDLVSGMLQIELASDTQFDTVVVTGALALGGSLDVVLLGDYSPESGSWQIATAGSFDGAFASVTDGFYVQQVGTALMLMVGAAPALAGDYNGNGVVDAADYTFWRDRLGQNVTLPNSDPMDDDGVVTQAEYTFWKSRFGATLGAGSGQIDASAVPEPASLVLAAGAAMALLLARRSATA